MSSNLKVPFLAILDHLTSNGDLFSGGAVHILGVIKGDTQGSNLCISSWLLGGDEVDQVEGEGVDNDLQLHKGEADGLEEGDEGEQAVLPNDHIQQGLVDVHERRERLHHELGIVIAKWGQFAQAHASGGQLGACGSNLGANDGEALPDFDALLWCIVVGYLGGHNAEVVGQVGDGFEGILDDIHQGLIIASSHAGHDQRQAVGVLGVFEGLGELVELVRRGRLLGGDEVDEVKSEGIDHGLQIDERDADGLEEGKQGGQPVLADHHGQERLVDFHESRERLHHELRIRVRERRGVVPIRRACNPSGVLGDLYDDGGEALRDHCPLHPRIEQCDFLGLLAQVVGEISNLFERLLNSFHRSWLRSQV